MIKRGLAGACLIIAVFAPIARGAIMLDRVVAIVNKEVITWSDVYRAMEFEASDEVKAMKDADRRRFFRENEALFLENLIDTKLELQEAAKDGIAAGDSDIETAIRNIKNKYAMTDELFKETIQKDGFTLDTYKKKLGEQIAISRLVDQEVKGKILVTEREINAYLAEHKDAAKDNEGFDISSIFMKKTGDDKQLEQKARDIYEKLKAGESFANLARQYSDAPSAQTGGDLGFIRRADMSGDFVRICSGIKPGDTGEPVWTNDGIYIIRVNEARVFNSEQEKRETIRQKLLNDKFNVTLKNWMRGLRERAYVEVKI